MKYRLVLDEPFNIDKGVKSGTGFLCDFEAQMQIKKGDQIHIDKTETEYLKIYEGVLPDIILKVKHCRHIIEKGKVEVIALFTKKID